MKIAVYGPYQRVGIVDGDQVIDANYAVAKYNAEKTDEPLPYAMAAAIAPSQLGEFIQSGPRALEAAQKAVEYLSKQAQDQMGPHGETVLHSLGSVRLHPPLASRASRIMTAGGNFARHVQQMRQNRLHEEVTVEQVTQETRSRGFWGFWKIAQNTVGQGEDVIYPERTKMLDYEAEIAVIFGKPAKDVPAAKANGYIWGYTMHNDWSARDQKDLPPYNFAYGKNFDTSSSLGPWIVVGEINDPQDVPFGTQVNGEQRQSGSTRNMIYSFAEYLEYLSRDMTILPGDLFSGGTCEGTAMDASQYDDDGQPTSGLYLKPGDVVEISSPLIGALRNRVIAKS